MKGLPPPRPACTAAKRSGRAYSRSTARIRLTARVDSLKGTMGHNPVNDLRPDTYWFRVKNNVMRWPDDSVIKDVDDSAERHIRTWVTAAYLAGAADCLRATMRMSPAVAQFIEMLTLLWGEDTYEALTTGLRTAAETPSVQAGDSTRGRTRGGQGVDDYAGMR